MTHDMELSIIQTLFKSSEYFNKVFPTLKQDHFTEVETSTMIKTMKDYIGEHGVKPTFKDIGLAIKHNNTIPQVLKTKTLDKFKVMATDEQVHNITAFVKSTARYIQQVELTKAIFASADIIKEDKNFTDVIGMVQDALSVNFDSDVGHDYNMGIEERMDYYTQKLHGLTTGVSSMDKALGGGLMKKTLNVIGGASHSGKSAFMASISAANLLQRKNVLFVTLEMSDLETSKRIDANILDMDINTFKMASKEDIAKQFNSVKAVLGKLIVKEYPAGSFNSMMLESLLQDLENENDFVPDLVVIDYIGLMASSRGVTLANTGNSNTVGTAIAEELHGFGKKYNLPVLTAAQLNRSAFGSLDAGMEATAGAIGVAQTADVMINMVSNDEMKELHQVVGKIVKNRNTGMLYNVMMNVEYVKMRYTDWDDGDVNMSDISSGMEAPNMNTVGGGLTNGIAEMGVLPPLDTSKMQSKTITSSIVGVNTDAEFDFGS